jgi:hypothetical protein
MSRFIMLMMLTTFICRAFIPVGYMPDLVDGDRRIPGLTFCLSNGVFNAMVLDQNIFGVDNAPDHGQASNDSCAFALLAAQTLLPSSDTSFLADLSPDVVFITFPERDIAVLPTRGPPLGSRAPPSLV